MQATFNASASVLFASAITGLLLSFPFLALVGYVIAAVTALFAVVALANAFKFSRESLAHEKRLLAYDKDAHDFGHAHNTRARCPETSNTGNRVNAMWQWLAHPFHL